MLGYTSISIVIFLSYIDEIFNYICFPECTRIPIHTYIYIACIFSIPFFFFSLFLTCCPYFCMSELYGCVWPIYSLCCITYPSLFFSFSKRVFSELLFCVLLVWFCVEHITIAFTSSLIFFLLQILYAFMQL